MSTIVRLARDHRGMWTALCPRCNTQFIYWDDDDLDDNGDLRCYCDQPAETSGRQTGSNPV